MTHEGTIYFVRRDDEVDGEEEAGHESGNEGYEPSDPFGDGDTEESSY